MRVPRVLRAIAALFVLGAFCASTESAHAAGILTVSTCGSGVFAHGAVFGINTSIFCPPGTNIPPGMTIAPGQNKVAQGAHATWQANAPAGLVITGAYVGQNEMYSNYINDGQSWGGGFYWSGGGAEATDNTYQFRVSGLNSPYFGFQVVCGWSTCDGQKYPAQLTVESINLYATETRGPSLSAPHGLWQSSGWVRGSWTVAFSGDSPSGVCSLAATLHGQPLPGSSSLVNRSVWHQCSAPAVSDTIQTGNYGQGPVWLTIRGTDAAGVSAGYSKIIRIDNAQPVVSLSGPTDVPSTAGTQYITATARGGPSGIEGLACALDSGHLRWFRGSSARLAVAGIGEHTVRCEAASNAVDGTGRHAWSAWATRTLSIRQPTVGAIGFTKLVDKLRCHRARKRVTIPAHWVTVHTGHGTVRVRERAHHQTVKVTRCHARVVHRRIAVWTTVVRHGHKRRVKRYKTIRVVKLPHVVSRTTTRVRHGRPTTVGGWLGLPDGTALAGRQVVVMSAPDDGLGRFTPAAVATTASDGNWSAKLPPGPSRLVEAVFAGSSTLEPTTSAQVHVRVPAKVQLIRIRPRRVAWGGTVHIVGRLVGGYLPADGALVRLRIGFGSAHTTYGVKEHVRGNGRFSTTYTFGLGDARIHRSYWFQIASLPMGDYPWAPSASRRVSVRVGGHPHHRRGATKGSRA